MPLIQPITSASGTFPYVPNTRTLTINGTAYDLSADRSWTISTSGSGTVTSVALSATMPTGLVASISGSPITSNGTLGLTITMQSGYSIPLTSKQTQWDSAYTFTSGFPTGTALQLFRINAAGTAYEFFTPTYISGVTASLPLVYNGGTNTISINQASSGANGYLSSTDWSTFNSKLNNPLTTLGDIIYSNASGAALRLAGNTDATQKFLSQTGDGFGNSAAPSWQEISAISIGAVPTSRTLTINGTSYDLSANRTWSVGTVTSVALTTTTSGISISGSPVTSSGNLNIEISTASGSANGLLSSSDWTSFNSRMTNPMTSLGDLIYGNAAGAPLRRAGNITTTKMFLTSTGDGTNAAAPVWEALIPSTIGAVPTTRTLTINGTSYDLSADRSWSVGTVTSVGLSSSTSGVTIGSTPITSSGTITLSIATASSGSNGLLSSTDWSAFNSKLNNPFSALGQMIYSNSAGAAVVVAPNTTTTKKFLAMTGDGTNGAAPVWDTISGIAGTGTASYVAKFTASSTIGNSLIYDTGVYVGVGHTSPSALLDVAGQTILRDSLYMGYGSASEYFMKIGQSRSGNGYAYLDLIGDTTYTGFGARFIRYNSGANSNTSIEHYGTGNLIFKTVNAARIEFQTGSASVGTIESNGNYIIGSAADSGEKLQVNGTAKITSNLAVDTNSLYVDATNNRVGVGTSSPQKLMHLSAANGATVIRMENTDAAVTSGETIGAIEFYGNDTSAGVGAIIDANGGGLSGEVNIDVWAGTNGTIVGGLTVKYTGVVNFTPYLSAPTPAAAGDVYYDATSNKLRCYDGTNWNDLF